MQQKFVLTILCKSYALGNLLACSSKTGITEHHVVRVCCTCGTCKGQKNKKPAIVEVEEPASIALPPSTSESSKVND